MKIFISLLLFQFTAICFAQDTILPKNHLVSLKETYNWKNESFLIVNYRLPKDYCPHENYNNLDISYNWLKNSVYSKLSTTDFRNVYVYYDKLAAKNIIDNKNHYDDVGQYFLNHFFDFKGNCYGVLIINKSGKYKVILGEYSHIDIQNAIENLK
jgi:hypothetical protein